MIDKTREEFEAWHKSELSNMVKAKEMVAARHFSDLKESFFCAWQASRAALVVELPSPVNITYTSDAGEKHDMGNFYADKHFLKALTKAGVTVK